jgi:hypothetical protein
MEQTFKGKIKDFEISDLEKNAFFEEYKLIVDESTPYHVKYAALFAKIGVALMNQKLYTDAFEIL